MVFNRLRATKFAGQSRRGRRIPDHIPRHDIARAVEEGREEELLRSIGAIRDAGRKQQYINKVFLEAARFGKAGFVRTLIGRGAEINAKELGYTALHMTARNGNAETVRLLIDEGIEANEQERRGWTALHLAALHRNSAVVRALIAKGVNIYIKDNSNRTALDLAPQGEIRDFIQMAIDRDKAHTLRIAMGATVGVLVCGGLAALGVFYVAPSLALPITITGGVGIIVVSAAMGGVLAALIASAYSPAEEQQLYMPL